MKTLGILIKRNTKLFFKDKGMFFTSLITPLILLLLYSTFLGKVFRDGFLSMMPAGVSPEEELINGFVGGQLISSLLAVSCVTVAFCSNMLMVQDKVNQTILDLTIAPVSRPLLAFSYFIASMLSTLLICFTAAGVCFLYLAVTGWYLSLSDVFLLLLDVFLLVLFGTVLSGLVNAPLSTQGQSSAVGTIVSSAYGFICGAYMPISQFTEGLQKVILCLPGTYGTGLIRNHAMNGVFAELEELGYPASVVDMIRDSVDCNLYFFDHAVSVRGMYFVLCGATVVLLAVYLLINFIRGKENR